MNELNPFKSESPASKGAVVEVEASRAMQEVSAAMAIAKQFPRDLSQAMDRILQSCTRVSLAENAIYAYPKGGTMVTGPSIRLAEAMAQNWGNIQFGIRELSQTNGESTVEAFAWDIETNTRQVKVFTVPHKRHTKRGVTILTDPRDIYELVANQGARRLRSCILGIIPGDVTDAAVRQCEMTQHNAVGAPAEQIEALVTAFVEYDVSKEMLVKRLGHDLGSTIVAEVLTLKRIYASLRDGMSRIDAWFDIPVALPIKGQKTKSVSGSKTDAVKNALIEK